MIKALASAALLAGLLIPSAVQAQILPRCSPHVAMIAKLLERYDERAIGIGLLSGVLIEILTSTTGATWTIILTKPDGESCIVAFGSDWQVRVPAEPGVETGEVR